MSIPDDADVFSSGGLADGNRRSLARVTRHIVGELSSGPHHAGSGQTRNGDMTPSRKRCRWIIAYQPFDRPYLLTGSSTSFLSV